MWCASTWVITMNDYGIRVENLDAYYGTAHVLFDVGIAVAPGQTFALLGRNGAGKSTLLKSIVRADVRVTGDIRYGGMSITQLPTYRIARLGVQLVPEDRRIYTGLTVKENLELGFRATAKDRPPIRIERMLEVFPTLLPLLGRHGNELSGGEQQLVAIARAMVGNPRVLLMDEPSAGLAPVVLDMVGASIARLRAETDITMIIAEQNARFALEMCEEVAILDRGRIVFTGSREDFERQEELHRHFLSV